MLEQIRVQLTQLTRTGALLHEVIVALKIQLIVTIWASLVHKFLYYLLAIPHPSTLTLYGWINPQSMHARSVRVDMVVL